MQVELNVASISSAGIGSMDMIPGEIYYVSEKSLGFRLWLVKLMIEGKYNGIG